MSQDQVKRIKALLKIEQWVRWSEFVARVQTNPPTKTSFGFNNSSLGEYLFDELFNYHPVLRRYFLTLLISRVVWDDSLVPTFLEMCDEWWERV
jgi:hypothetical protein